MSTHARRWAPGNADSEPVRVGTDAIYHLPRHPSARVGFLFNHEALHQIAHSAPIIRALRTLHPDIEVTVLASSSEQLELAERIIGEPYASQVSFVALQLPRPLRRVVDLLRRASPAARIATLRWNAPLLQNFDSLVVPETTTALFRDRLGLHEVELVYTHHGAGDRSIGFKPVLKQFDLVLVAGPKIRNRLLSLGFIAERSHDIVGYPKFDAVGAFERRERIDFGNTNPVVLYNPHFDPSVTSWYKVGLDVLEFFAQRRHYNLVFAPHVMLFQRRVHTSLESGRVGLRRRLPEKYLRCPNIRVDLGSERCVDMTYTLGSDVYLGDASSQVYEFLLRPRPCIFLDPRGVSWQDDPNYLHWRAGPVLRGPEELDSSLADAVAEPDAYRAVQQRLFAETFDLQDEPSALRAARSIARHLPALEARSLASSRVS